jgi:hypothetical protein
MAGDTAQSRMLQVLEGGHFARLTDHQMELLTQWIANGLVEQ